MHGGRYRSYETRDSQQTWTYCSRAAAVPGSACSRPWAIWFRSEFLPVLVLSPAEQNVAGLERIARLLAELAVAQPGVALALLVEQGLFDSYVALAPASRAKSLLRESVITLPWPELGRCR